MLIAVYLAVLEENGTRFMSVQWAIILLGSFERFRLTVIIMADDD